MIEQIVLVAHITLPPLGCRIFRDIHQAREGLKNDKERYPTPIGCYATAMSPNNS